MALSRKALQRKREKKKKKRNKSIRFQQDQRLTSYQGWSFYESWISVGLWESGMGQAIVSRKNNVGEIAMGIFLIDVFCLGIKNCFVRLTDFSGYKDMLAKLEESCNDTIQQSTSDYVTTLIYKAIDYAKNIGFKPHPDFVKVKKILDGLEINNSIMFNFGKDGKPCFIQGPYDSPTLSRKILKTLEMKVGPKNFDFMVQMEPLDVII